MNELVFGYQDDNDKSLESKIVSTKFGLNRCNVTRIAVNHNAGKNNTPLFAFEFDVMINGSEMKTKVFNVERVFYKGKEVTDKSSEDYKTAYVENMKQNMAVITHMIKSLGVTDDAIKAKFSTNASDFKQWCEMMLSLVPADYKTKSVDIFLEYQWSIQGDNDKTYLEIPRSMKGGRFLCPANGDISQWIEQREWVNEKGIVEKGLRYVNSEGVVHPFTRTQTYMESNRANQQKDLDVSDVKSVQSDNTAVW